MRPMTDEQLIRATELALLLSGSAQNINGCVSRISLARAGWGHDPPCGNDDSHVIESNLREANRLLALIGHYRAELAQVLDG